MPTISRFEEIEAWKTARQLTNLIYEFSVHEKFSRDFDLADKVLRQVVRFIAYLVSHPESRRIRDDGASYIV